MRSADVKDYEPAVTALAPLLHNLPGKLIAIDGLPGAGKTTLVRFLACTFNVSLIETDLFLVEGPGRLVYRKDEIDQLIEKRLKKPRPVIVEGASVLRLLADLNRNADFLIYLTNQNAPEIGGSLALDLANYHASFTPDAKADLVLPLNHTG